MYDLVVIGGGSGGVRAARMAAGFGARVAMVEAGRLGGTCVNVGCVPKKLMVYGASFAERFAEAPGFGWTLHAEPTLDWATLADRREAEIRRLNGVYRGLLTGAGVEIVEGFGRLAGPGAVQVGERRLEARKILVATGSRPLSLTLPGGELALNSDAFFALRSQPRRVAVIGGGYIGVELAAVFEAVHSEVTVIHKDPLLLNAFDGELRRFFTEQLALHGVKLRLGLNVARVEARGEARAVILDDGSEIEADLVLAAVGRAPATAGLGLAEAGVELRRDGTVVVGDDFQTACPGVYAVGDCINRAQLTPVALAEGMAFARAEFGGLPQKKLDYNLIPTAVFSNPEVATVGLSEERARQLGPCTIFRSSFRPMKHTLSGQPYKMLMKLVVCTRTDRVLGVHVAGPDAGEIVQGFAVALQAGATKAQFDATVGIHPTAAEELVTMRTPAAS